MNSKRLRTLIDSPNRFQLNPSLPGRKQTNHLSLFLTRLLMSKKNLSPFNKNRYMINRRKI
jgi:hypothetical protein